jgi:hypothetical protein
MPPTTTTAGVEKHAVVRIEAEKLREDRADYLREAGVVERAGYVWRILNERAHVEWFDPEAEDGFVRFWVRLDHLTPVPKAEAEQVLAERKARLEARRPKSAKRPSVPERAARAAIERFIKALDSGVPTEEAVEQAVKAAAAKPADPTPEGAPKPAEAPQGAPRGNAPGEPRRGRRKAAAA